MPVTMADAGRVGSDVPQNCAPMMAPTPVAAALPARPALSIVPRDAIAAAVEEIDAKIAPRGEMHRFEPCRPGGKVLFRYIEADGKESTFGIDEDRLTPRVRAALWALAQLIEEEGR